MYTDLTKQRVIDVLNAFLNEERGNRITQYNMNGLATAIVAVFDQHEAKDKQAPDEPVK